MMKSSNKFIRLWLLTGLTMIFIQIVIGGITRLTGSGLSITKWDIVVGAIPPLNEEQWQEAFDLYKITPQYQKINQGMSLGSFKWIFFWEYIHRLWARSMGFVFLIPFIYFMFKGWLSKKQINDLLVVVFMAGLVGAFGWIMVASGLKDRPWVNAYKLSIHLSLALITMGYLLYTYLKYFDISVFPDLKGRLVLILLVLVFVQVFLGGMMSGMKAALMYPSFPKMGQYWIDPIVFDSSSWQLNNFILYDKHPFLTALVQMLHRIAAFLILILYLYMVYKTGVNKWIRLLGIFLFVQIILGITTLVLSKGTIPVSWGVLHQACGILTLLLVFKWYVDNSLKAIRHNS